jgi:glutamine amidotransferase
MERLTRTGLGDAIVEAVRSGDTPVLGICLGMQLLTEGSEESGTLGLGLVPGRTVHLRNIVPTGFPLPHIGWAEVAWRADRLPQASGTTPLYCYFSHSYHVECEQDQILATATYGNSFVVGVMHGGALGVQFHPEKSHRSGIERLLNLIEVQRTLRPPS